MSVAFSWDEQKNQENIRKHGVSFQEAATVFLNIPLEIFYDPDHSNQEDRYIAVGYSNTERVLLVVHCENATGSEIRIISARKATPSERRQFLRESKT